MIMKKPELNFNNIRAGRNWTLFMDRDGVINKQIIDGYVLSNDQFEFLPGVLKAIPMLNLCFDRIFIVTNQQCIGYGLISALAIEGIHKMMLSKINDLGGSIDHVFVAPYLESDKNTYRKPGIGMVLDALRSYPDTDLSKSIMVGDSESDMQLGRNAGIYNVLINGHEEINPDLIDHSFNSLLEFTLQFQ